MVPPTDSKVSRVLVSVEAHREGTSGQAVIWAAEAVKAWASEVAQPAQPDRQPAIGAWALPTEAVRFRIWIGVVPPGTIAAEEMRAVKACPAHPAAVAVAAVVVAVAAVVVAVAAAVEGDNQSWTTINIK